MTTPTHNSFSFSKQPSDLASSFSPTCVTLLHQLQQEEIQFKKLQELNDYDGDMRGPGTKEQLNLYAHKISKLHQQMRKKACPEAAMRAYLHTIKDKKN